MKNFLKGIGIGICIGIPLLAVLLIASHITGWPSFLHKNASMQEEFSQDSEEEESDFTGNTGIENDSYQESDSNSEDTRNNESGMAEDSTQVSEDADISTDETSGTGDVLPVSYTHLIRSALPLFLCALPAHSSMPDLPHGKPTEGPMPSPAP